MKYSKKLILLFSFFVLSTTSYSVNSDEKVDINTEITNIKNQMSENANKVSDLLNKSSNLKIEISKNNEKIKVLQEVVANQARNIQQSGNNYGVLPAILSSKNLSELFNTLTNGTTVISANQNQIKELDKLIKENNKKENEFNSEITELKNQSDQYQANLANLESKLQEIEDLEAQAAAIAQAQILEENAKSVAETVNSQAVQSVSNQSSSTGQTNAKSYAPSQAREAFEQITADLGISASEKAIWAEVITAESGWNTTVWNGGGSGAYGLGQALPASKMAVYGSDYMTNPYTQLTWMYNYVIERYGSFAGINWASRGWY